MVQYLASIDSLIPWRIHTTHALLQRRVIPKDKSPVGNGLFLVGSYYFTDISGAKEFVTEVKKVAREEKHDPSFMRIHERVTHLKSLEILPNTIDVEKASMVYLRINTHEAYIPDEISDLRRDLPAQGISTSLQNEVVPGLTMRDVRFVWLVDQLFRDRFLKATPESESESESESDPSTSSQAPDTPTTNTGFVPLVYPPDAHLSSSARAHPEIIQKLASSLQQSNPSDTVPTESIQRVAHLIDSVFRHRFCPCCGLLHPLRSCPVREEYPPLAEQFCKYCHGEGHWSVDCVERPMRAESKSSTEDL
ncbi:hypothetical protein EV360DRAFT_66214 [Lentinula raphanica]|nr:hypothetical protein EV360DRAFT_66214 [Lentinula raphanica]